MTNEESNRITKECLHTALIRLMGEKEFDKITITELVKMAGVSRTAFYRNYTSKEMILTELSNAFLVEMTRTLSAVHTSKDTYDWYYHAFQAVYDNAALFGLILQARLPKDSLLGTSCILEIIMPSHTPSEHYRLVALENSFAAILADWFRNGMKESISSMADFCTRTFPIL